VTFSSISVLVPTRGRPDQVRALIRSYEATCGDPRICQLLFRADLDDQPTIDLLQRGPHKYLIGPRLNGYRSLPQFFQELYALAGGDLVMCGNDDMIFCTPDWPTKILAVANQFPDGVFNLGVSTFNEGHLPFSIISRAAVEAMGHVQDPRIFWGDIYLRDVMAAFGRVIMVPDVRVDHNWAGHAPDQTFTEAEQGRLPDRYWELHVEAIAEAVNKLRRLAAPWATSRS
jgi:hypothetical protein